MTDRLSTPRDLREPTYETVCEQNYGGNNCRFSAGVVFGALRPRDTLFLRIEKDMPDGSRAETTFLLRPDEMAAIAWVANGALWSDHMSGLTDSLRAEGKDDDA